MNRMWLAKQLMTRKHTHMKLPVPSVQHLKSINSSNILDTLQLSLILPDNFEWLFKIVIINDFVRSKWFPREGYDHNSVIGILEKYRGIAVKYWNRRSKYKIYFNRKQIHEWMFPFNFSEWIVIRFFAIIFFLSQVLTTVAYLGIILMQHTNNKQSS